ISQEHVVGPCNLPFPTHKHSRIFPRPACSCVEHPPNRRSLKPELSMLLYLPKKQFEEVDQDKACTNSHKLLVHCYQVIDPDICMSGIQSLGAWILSYPSLFLQDLYLKYLGWTLNVKSVGVRKASILALQDVYNVDDNVSSLILFTKRFYKRTLNLADDNDISFVAEQGGWENEGGTTSQLDAAADMETQDTKDQAFDTFKEYKKTIEKELGTTLKMLRTDRGGEFTSNEFTQYCKENGIARQLTAPYSPQQNGVVERRNRTIMSTTRCMMKATNNPQNFWAEAVRHAIYILNNVPTKALEYITPYEAIKRKKAKLRESKSFRLHSICKDEPKNYKEASSDQKWIEAMKVELDSINRNNTWELTTLPKGHKATGLKWVFKTKKDANRNITKHKARLVAKGYIQEHSID
nr:zinc finger, CCHC-type [Tanacetum cinerariifolium]